MNKIIKILIDNMSIITMCYGCFNISQAMEENDEQGRIPAVEEAQEPEQQHNIIPNEFDYTEQGMSSFISGYHEEVAVADSEIKLCNELIQQLRELYELYKDVEIQFRQSNEENMYDLPITPRKKELQKRYNWNNLYWEAFDDGSFSMANGLLQAIKNLRDTVHSAAKDHNDNKWNVNDYLTWYKSKFVEIITNFQITSDAIDNKIDIIQNTLQKLSNVLQDKFPKVDTSVCDKFAEKLKNIMNFPHKQEHALTLNSILERIQTLKQDTDLLNKYGINEDDKMIACLNILLSIKKDLSDNNKNHKHNKKLMQLFWTELYHAYSYIFDSTDLSKYYEYYFAKEEAENEENNNIDLGNDSFNFEVDEEDNNAQSNLSVIMKKESSEEENSDDEITI